MRGLIRASVFFASLVDGFRVKPGMTIVFRHTSSVLNVPTRASLLLAFEHLRQRVSLIERERAGVEQEISARPHALVQDARDPEIVDAAVFRARGVGADVFAGMEHGRDVDLGQQPRVGQIDIAEIGEIVFR